MHAGEFDFVIAGKTGVVFPELIELLTV
jgi:hypothetical protein